jgi:7 transmembrane sweet-taste receptor of 3 GCPR/Receptor family ligand binding region
MVLLDKISVGADHPAHSPTDLNELESTEECNSNSFVVRNGMRRQANLVSILSVEDRNEDTMRFRVFNEVAAWLAFYHMTHPELHILPEVGARFSDCNIDFSLRMFDDHYERLTAARHLSELFFNFNVTGGSTTCPKPEEVPPIALLGSVRTPTTSILSVLSSSYGIPLISAGATSAYLDNREIYPMFARTVPSSRGDALAVVSLLEELNVKHFAVLYVNDDFGKAFNAEVLSAANRVRLAPQSFGYENNNKAEISVAIEQLKTSGLRYVVAILHSEYKNVVDEATKVGLLNSTETTWFLTVASAALGDEGIKIDPDNALALNGSGLVRIWVDKEASALSQEIVRFSNSPILQNMYINARDDNATFSNFSFQDLALNPYIYLTYDAMTALGLAACAVPKVLFNGSELYGQLLQTEFNGVSGPVRFNRATGTRLSDELKYEVVNLLVSPEQRMSDGKVTFDQTKTSYIIDPAGVEMRGPFIFPNGTTTPPEDLPPPKQIGIEHEAIIVGYTLAAVVMVTSVGWMYWTWRNRNKDIVKAAQPLFLWQLCIGTLLIGSSIIPMSMQDNEDACMIIPWLLSFGFVTTWSALFAKTWRLNRMVRSAQSFRRVKISSLDVMLPFFVMLAVNFVLLLAWTLTAPLTWVWYGTGSIDEYGRSELRYGACGRPLEEVWPFLGPILSVNMIAFGITVYQCYDARHLSCDFSEAASLFTSMGCVLETLIVGAPLLFVASEYPSAQFLIQTMLLCIVCLGILVPVFLPKYHRRSVIEQEAALQNATIQCDPAVLRTNSSFLGMNDSENRNEPASDPLAASRTGSIGSTRFGAVIANTDGFRGSVPFTGFQNSTNNRVSIVSQRASGQCRGPLYQPSASGRTSSEFRMSTVISSSFGPRASISGMLTNAMHAQAEENSDQDQAPSPVGTSLVSRSETYFTQLATDQLLRQSGTWGIRRPNSSSTHGQG